jgi:hypothetical protein
MDGQQQLRMARDRYSLGSGPGVLSDIQATVQLPAQAVGALQECDTIGRFTIVGPAPSCSG